MNHIDDIINEVTGKIRYEFTGFSDSISWFQSVDKPELLVMEFEDSGTGA